MNSMRRRARKLYQLLPPLVVRELKERYAGSAFGILWTFLHPVLFILLYWLVFSQVLQVRVKINTGDIPFLPFLLSGLLPWFALQEGVLRGASAVLDKRHVIKKVIFPVELFPLSSVMSAFIHHSVGIVIFLFSFFIWKGAVTAQQLFFIMILLCIQILLTAGLSLLFSSLSVYLRDIIQVLGVLFQVIFYMSTILYPLTSVPGKLKFFILTNPVTALAESYHSAILLGVFPEIGSFLYLVILTAFVVVAGIYTFRKLKKGFADVL
jgi:ABC-type polysaccharide/polyol phosphate export permease